MAGYIRPPSLSPAGVVRLVKDCFPFKLIEEASVKELVSYDDRNYYFRGNLSVELPTYASKQKVHVTSNNEFVLKILNHRESKAIDTVEMLTCMKKFLYSNGLNVPYPISSLEGSEIITLKESFLLQYADHHEEPINDEHEYRVRVLTYIPGRTFAEVDHTPLLMYKYGSYLATMHVNLKSFSHPGALARKYMLWDLQYLHTLRYLIPKGIKDPNKLSMITKIFDDFETNVTPLIPDLPHSVIHNDFNDMNVIISSLGNKELEINELQINGDGELEINGVIDFSDCVYTPTVFDLGIAMAYAMLQKPDPVLAVAPLLAGYYSILELSEKELDLLYYIVMGRLAQSCANGEYAYQLEPSNEYLLVSVRPAWLVIEKVLAVGKNDCDLIWRKNLMKHY